MSPSFCACKDIAFLQQQLEELRKSAPVEAAAIPSDGIGLSAMELQLEALNEQVLCGFITCSIGLKTLSLLQSRQYACLASKVQNSSSFHAALGRMMKQLHSS